MGIFPCNWSLDIAGLFIVLCGSLYLYFAWYFDYWQIRGVKFLRPWPLIGNMKFNKNMGEFFADVYHQGEGKDYIGIWIFRKPCLVLRDPNIIRTVLVKNFNCFDNRYIHANTNHDSIGSSILFAMKNPKWKRMRGKLNPLFTPGKLRAMFTLIDYVAVELQNAVKSHGEEVLDAREITASYAIDVIASLAFGLSGGSLQNPASTFGNLGREVFKPCLRRGIELISILFAPAFAEFFRFKVFTEKCSNDLRELFWEGARRRQAGSPRGDMLDALLKLKAQHESEGSQDFSGDSLVGQVAAFFSAGFETSSSALGFSLYELALNPDIQEKLVADIEKVLKMHDGKFSYEALQDMSYLELCVKEALRLYPPLSFLERVCSVECADVPVAVGAVVCVPILALHRDERFFPEPLRFRPERFTDQPPESFTYMPFGEGPRFCIGDRLGLLQVKLGLARLMTAYRVECAPSTPRQLRMDPRALQLAPLGGLPLIFHPRETLKSDT